MYKYSTNYAFRGAYRCRHRTQVNILLSIKITYSQTHSLDKRIGYMKNLKFHTI